MNSLSLFSGVGRADAALESLGVRTAAFSEVEPYAASVMRKRFPNALDVGDIRELRGDDLAHLNIRVMSGGFPCQDISNAGKRAGITGDKSSLWGEYARLIGEMWPGLVFIENVAALLNRGLDVVLRDLYLLGYAAEWDCIPAAAVGAPHLRDRIWLVAYPDSRDPLHVFGEERLERSLATLEHPPTALPRAGRMEQGAVFVNQPVAPRKTKRLTPGSAWIGARLSDSAGWWHEAALWATPRASDGMKHPLRDPANIRNGNARGRLEDQIALAHGEHGGFVNAAWTEWAMGMPVGWTDLAVDNPVAHSWDHEPAGVPRVIEGQPHRRERLTCIGNALVSQVQEWVARRALERVG